MSDRPLPRDLGDIPRPLDPALVRVLLDGVPAERDGVLAGLAPDDLADIAETLRDVLGLHEREHAERMTRYRAAIASAEQFLFSKLGPGEAVIAAKSTGRVAFWGLVSGGTAKVNQRALDELPDTAPDALRPQVKRTYPTVTAIRRAKSALKESGIDVGDLIVEPPRVPGLRWRSIEGAGDDA